VANILIRTCWNTNHYQAPAGVGHLAETQINYVSNEGYGVEEWNFNKDELVDGFLYGYIRPDFKSLVGKTHNIYFYTKDPSGNLFIIDHYTDAYFQTDSERRELKKVMKEQGLLQKRIKQVYDILKSIPEFQNCSLEDVKNEFKGISNFKLKVKPKNAVLYKSMKPFSEALWHKLSPEKKLCKRYHGYNFIPNLSAFEQAI
jgi:hypothetical protein